jgi:hypothetical protein
MFMKLPRVVIACARDGTKAGAFKPATCGITLTAPEKWDL